MPFKETTIITRANTAISWPGAGYDLSSNNLSKSGEGTYFTTSTSTSDDNLTLTTVRIYPDFQKCLDVKLSANDPADIHNFIYSLHNPGIVLTRIMEFI